VASSALVAGLPKPSADPNPARVEPAVEPDGA